MVHRYEFEITDCENKIKLLFTDGEYENGLHKLDVLLEQIESFRNEFKKNNEV